MKIEVKRIEKLPDPLNFEMILRGVVYFEVSGDAMEEFFGEHQQYEGLLNSINGRGMVGTTCVREIPNEILHEALRETIENMVLKKL